MTPRWMSCAAASGIIEQLAGLGSWIGSPDRDALRGRVAVVIRERGLDANYDDYR
jgi:hypothetical protein